MIYHMTHAACLKYCILFISMLTLGMYSFVRNMLDDTSDILRARRESPHTSLSIWKRINWKRLRKEGLFVESYATGLS